MVSDYFDVLSALNLCTSSFMSVTQIFVLFIKYEKNGNTLQFNAKSDKTITYFKYKLKLLLKKCGYSTLLGTFLKSIAVRYLKE